jgi:hypothetical protein
VITLIDLKHWIQKKAHDSGGPWKILMSHQEIILIAHQQALRCMTSRSGADLNLFHATKPIIDIAHFRSVLIQLFAISIFWVHFKQADDHTHHYEDGVNCKLDKVEFGHAIRTFCATYGQEHVSAQQIERDFELLPKAEDNLVTFAEVILTHKSFFIRSFA